MKSVTFVFILVFISVGLYGQSSFDSTPASVHFKKAKIRLKNNELYLVKDITIEGDSLCFTFKHWDQKERIALSSIKLFEFQKKTRVVGGAIWGAVIPFIFILDDLVDNEPNADNAGLYSAGFLAGCAMIGAAVGMSMPVWETYDIKNPQNIGMSLNNNIKANSKMRSASVVVNF